MVGRYPECRPGTALVGSPGSGGAYHSEHLERVPASRPGSGGRDDWIGRPLVGQWADCVGRPPLRGPSLRALAVHALALCPLVPVCDDVAPVALVARRPDMAGRADRWDCRTPQLRGWRSLGALTLGPSRSSALLLLALVWAGLLPLFVRMAEQLYGAAAGSRPD